jgi:hypothetical protein
MFSTGSFIKKIRAFCEKMDGDAKIHLLSTSKRATKAIIYTQGNKLKLINQTRSKARCLSVVRRP